MHDFLCSAFFWLPADGPNKGLSFSFLFMCCHAILPLDAAGSCRAGQPQLPSSCSDTINLNIADRVVSEVYMRVLNRVPK